MSPYLVVGRLLVMLLVLELTLRGLMMVPSVRLQILCHTPWDGAAELDWYYRYVAHLRTSGLERAGAPGHELAWDAELGWVPEPGRPGVDEDGRRAGVTARPGGDVRLVLVGDSFVWGSDAPVEDTFAHLLDERRPELEVINLGVPGYGPLQMALRAERELPRLQPDAVVLLGLALDVPRVLTRANPFAKPHLAWRDDEPVVVGTPVPTPRMLAARVALRPRLLDLLAVYELRREGYASRFERAVPLARFAYERVLAAVRDVGATPLVIALPDTSHPPPPALHDPGGRFWREFCEGRDFPCVDHYEAYLARVPDVEVVSAGGHWNRLGHEIVADFIEAELVGAGLLP